MKYINASLIVLLIIFSSSFAKTNTDSINLGKLVTANNNFGFQMFGKLTDNNPTKNIFISPTSITMCLGMAYNGAAKKTKDAMAKTLGLDQLTLPQANEANLKLSEQLKSSDPKVVLNIANSLWAHEGINFKKNFLESNKNYYQAEVSTLNFTDKESPERINNWVNDKTNGKIPTIVDKLDPAMLMVLVNAIYFNGKWTTTFDTAKTKNLPFTLLNGKDKDVPMMNQEDYYHYFENENFQAISLPYGKGRMSMYIFLPKSDFSLADFVSSLNEKSWNDYLAQFKYEEGEITLPRFKFEYEHTLNEALISMGMTNTFADADFTNMTDSPALISGVLHKTFVEVNEEGTEAAAVTSVFVATAMANQPEPFSMVVDHPFFCAIVDNTTNTILFMGAVTEPQ